MRTPTKDNSTKENATKDSTPKSGMTKESRVAIPRHRTKNDIPEKERARSIDLLNARLAETIDLYMQVKQAHWNVKGPQFIALHELFDKVAETVEGGIDDIAERAVALGGTALGTVQVVSAASRLAPYPLNISAGTDHVEALSTALAACARSIREASDMADEIGDADTTDLFTGFSRDLDKMLWFVEAHQQ